MANLFELPRYIAVEGPIRVGKSTLAGILSERLNAQRVIEPEDNPFLGAFYEGDRGAAFQAQLTFLIRRFEQLPVLLPEQIEITQQGGSPLARIADFVNVTCPKCHGPAKSSSRPPTL